MMSSKRSRIDLIDIWMMTLELTDQTSTPCMYSADQSMVSFRPTVNDAVD